jgi:hypothetical protein
MRAGQVDKSIISTPDIRLNLFRLLKLMEDTELAIEYHHHGMVYKLKSYPTGQKYKRTRKIRTKINPLTITSSKCNECGGLSLNDVCMNDQCRKLAPLTIS